MRSEWLVEHFLPKLPQAKTTFLLTRHKWSVSAPLELGQAVTQVCKHRCEVSCSLDEWHCLFVGVSVLLLCLPSFLSLYVCLVFTPFFIASSIPPTCPDMLQCESDSRLSARRDVCRQDESTPLLWLTLRES